MLIGIQPLGLENRNPFNANAMANAMPACILKEGPEHLDDEINKSPKRRFALSLRMHADIAFAIVFGI